VVQKISLAAFDALVAEVMSHAPYCTARPVFWIVDNGTIHWKFTRHDLRRQELLRPTEVDGADAVKALPSGALTVAAATTPRFGPRKPDALTP